jgi:DTW domain-containing protein YfiP
MQTKVCICDAIPSLTPSMEFVVLRHWKERLKPSNTARLAAHAIPGLQLVDYGAPGQPWDPACLDLEGAALLFPDPDAPTLTNPSRIIIVDGSWPQARKLVNKIDGLADLPRFKIQPPAEHRVRLRTPPQPGCVSTLEAIAAVLDLTEGPRSGDSLRALFDAAVHSATITRGRPLHA